MKLRLLQDGDVIQAGDLCRRYFNNSSWEEAFDGDIGAEIDEYMELEWVRPIEDLPDRPDGYDSWEDYFEDTDKMINFLKEAGDRIGCGCGGDYGLCNKCSDISNKIDLIMKAIKR